MKKKNLSVSSIGIISLMMIFMILCIVTLATLSLSSSSGEARLGEKMTEHLTEYYTASNEAEKLLAFADNVFAYAYQNTDNAKDYYLLISGELLTSPIVSTPKEDSLEASFQIEMNDSEALSVVIDILSPQQIRENKANAFYNILSWQVIRTTPWESDNSLQLIQ